MADHHQSLSLLTTTVSSPILHPIERILSGEAADDRYLGDSGSAELSSESAMESTHIHEFTQFQLNAGMWITRTTGIISLVFSICMVWRAWNRRFEGMFHRLVFGMGIHLIIFGIANTIGSAAIPGDTTNALGNTGTTATCTAQGFLIYVTFLTACCYYCSFSVFSYIGTLNSFETVLATEKYIHVFVHIYPICSGIYLITEEIFNNSGFGYCFLEADPIGCGEGQSSSDDNGFVPCERGPASHKEAQLLELFWAIPLYLEMFVPTAIMVVLYFKVKKNQLIVQIPANEVAKQAAVYLLVLYFGIFPSAVTSTLEWSYSLSISSNLFADVMFMLFGLLSMLTYLYFTTGDWLATVDIEEEDVDEDDQEGHDRGAFQSTDFIFGHLEKALKQEGTGSGAIVDKSMGSSKSKSKSLKKRKSRFSFNIFDGTNADGAFADFVFDGDSADFRADKKETDKWEAVQEYI